MSQNRQPFNTSARHQSVVIVKVEVFDNEQPTDLGSRYEIWYTVGYAIVYNCVNISNDLVKELKGSTVSP